MAEMRILLEKERPGAAIHSLTCTYADRRGRVAFDDGAMVVVVYAHEGRCMSATVSKHATVFDAYAGAHQCTGELPTEPRCSHAQLLERIDAMGSQPGAAGEVVFTYSGAGAQGSWSISGLGYIADDCR